MGELRITWGSGKARGGPSRGPDVGCMLHDTLRDTVAFPCPLACSPPLPPLAPLPFALLPRCLLREYPGHGGCVVGLRGGEGLTLARVPSPGVFPLGGRCFHSPSGCNAIVRAVHLYPLGTNGPAS